MHTQNTHNHWALECAVVIVMLVGDGELCAAHLR